MNLDYIKIICCTQNVSINKINKGNYEDLIIPDWLNKKIMIDFHKEIKEKQGWTTKEIRKVLEYKKQNFSYSEIAKKTKRTYSSVYKKISEFNKFN